MSKKIQVPLPDTQNWQPRKDAVDTLKSAFLKRCLGIEQRIQSRVEHELSMNIDNYDSGLAIEEIFREEFKKLLPARYSVGAGVISDNQGSTSGDCDLVVFNEFWFPVLKSGVTESARRVILPIDGVYAVGEIKQSLDIKVLDNAMEKLVVCHRLNRPKTYAYRITENLEGSSCSHGLKNPLYSFIIVTNLRKGVSLDDIVERFFHINKSLKRLDVVRALCVLGHGTVTWGVRGQNEIKPAMFMLDDLYRPIVPVYSKSPKTISPLYMFVTDLLLHLYHSILAPEDIAPSYGALQHQISIPSDMKIALEPDPEHIAKLQTYCESDDKWHQHSLSSGTRNSNNKKRKRH